MVVMQVRQRDIYLREAARLREEQAIELKRQARRTRQSAHRKVQQAADDHLDNVARQNATKKVIKKQSPDQSNNFRNHVADLLYPEEREDFEKATQWSDPSVHKVVQSLDRMGEIVSGLRRL